MKLSLSAVLCLLILSFMSFTVQRAETKNCKAFAAFLFVGFGSMPLFVGATVGNDSDRKSLTASFHNDKYGHRWSFDKYGME